MQKLKTENCERVLFSGKYLCELSNYLHSSELILLMRDRKTSLVRKYTAAAAAAVGFNFDRIKINLLSGYGISLSSVSLDSNDKLASFGESGSRLSIRQRGE